MTTNTSTQAKGRRDVHRPVNLVTEDYDYVEAYDSQLSLPPMPIGGDEEVLRVWRSACEAVRNYMRDLRDKVATSSVHRGLSQCHHCGAHIRYGALLRHRPTDTYIAVGEICLENRFERATEEFQRLRKAAQLDRERVRKQEQINEFCEANPDLGFMANDPREFPASWPIDARENSFVLDVAAKLRHYGSISERQINAVRKAVKRDRERRLERAQEEWIPVPSRDERVRVEGVVLSTRWDHGYQGDLVQRMLLRVETTGGNYKIWGNAPSRLNVQRGDRIRFTVRITRSDRDDYFGFFKMDSGSRAELVEQGEEQ
jgi:hypothetical protein